MSLGRDPVQGVEEVVGALLEGARRADRCRGRVVDLVCRAGRQGAECHESVTLAGVLLDATRRPDQPAQQVDREREPLRTQRAQPFRRETEHPGPLGHPAAAHVDTVLVPGAESAGPLAGTLHRGHHRLVVADPPHDVDPSPEEHPPVVGRSSFLERACAHVENHFLAGGREGRDLVVGEPVEEGVPPELGAQHQVVAR
jgi:hypothetical protein